MCIVVRRRESARFNAVEQGFSAMRGNLSAYSGCNKNDGFPYLVGPEEPLIASSHAACGAEGS
ncbi:hypothetical protein, partial [Coralloluteibacterium thermophilus]